jgi:phytoene dehydrogenase-like protein
MSMGGRIVTNSRVGHLDELGSPDLTLCDVTPRQFLALAEGRIRTPYRRLLEKYRYGPGVFKVDWALREPIPWKAADCRQAITVHLGGTLEEIAASERAPWNGLGPEKPFVLLAQPSLFDPSRAPAGRHTAWAYCHVPNGWGGSALEQIENQVERFAPGFRDCVLARAVHGTFAMEQWNENLVGGDINGGAFTPLQLAFRPTWREYRTPLRGVNICSSSTLPGGGVHGMCGYNAAHSALTAFDKRA